MKFKQLLCGVALGAMLLSTSTAMANLLVETETFETLGGWRLDHQAFEKIGSSYIQAHGYGRPVADASTQVQFENPGKYHVYVSTYNWTSPWSDEKGPGSFQLIVDNKTMPNTLGDSGDCWDWQYAGEVEVGKSAKLTLHDLTGFHGRADAIYFSKEKFAPSNDKEALRLFRRKELGFKGITDCGEFDLVVAGGGVAGCCTALTAARYGLKVALIDNLPGIGGNHYLAGCKEGLINKERYRGIGNMLRQLSELPIPQTDEEYENEPHDVNDVGLGRPIIEKTGKDLAPIREQMLRDAGVALYQQVQIFEVDNNSDGSIRDIVGKSLVTGEELRFSGKLYSDCTGDGVIGYLGGADYRMGRESRAEANEALAPEKADDQTMGMTLWWVSAPAKKEASFPSLDEMPWAMQCSDEYYFDSHKGGWFWETGLYLDSALEAELIRDNMFRAIYGNFSYLKNNIDKYKDYEIRNISNYGMKRESRRMMGDIILTQNDIIDHVDYPDASFTTTWPIDIHFAEEKNAAAFPGWEWITECTNEEEGSFVLPPYQVPYRVLYSRNVDNLFVGGRCMSVTHVALGTVRVAYTLGLAGEVAGMAAKICVEHDCTPREVYEKHLDELIQCMTDGAPLE